MKGMFRPRNPTKYRGNPTNIVYRSSWELKAMMVLDRNPDVKNWSSEEIKVPYRSPLDGYVHNYYPDLYLEMIDGNKFLLEIKPENQTKPPVITETKKHKPTKASLKAAMDWARNNAKWDSAKLYCEKRGWQFRILTEKELNIPSNTNRKSSWQILPPQL